MKISITTQILSGNLGDGWADEVTAAEALAAYTHEVWMNDLAEFVEAGHSIDIDIDVQRATGCSKDVDVDVDGSSDEAYELVDRVRNVLTDENRIWEEFCSSDDAVNLAAE